MSSPWAKIEKPEPVNLKEIMSEQLASEFQCKEDQYVAHRVHEQLNGELEIHGNLDDRGKIDARQLDAGKSDAEKLNADIFDTEKLDTGNLDTGELNTEKLNTKKLNTEKLNTEKLNTEKLNTEKLNTEELNTEKLTTEKWIEENLKEDSKLEVAGSPEDFPVDMTDANCDSDAVIAALLQQEEDKSYNNNLSLSEKKLNALSKVGISYSNYRRKELDYGSDSEEEEELVDPRDRKDWDRFDSVNRHFATMPPCGYQVNHDGSMVTKHDPVMSGRRNAYKLMNFQSEFQTGDTAAFDMKLPNNVFNSLKLHSKHEQQRRIRHHDKKEERATAAQVIDQYTKELLYKLINTVKVLEDVTGVIQIGKEASVVHATGNKHCPLGPVPENCCVKIYKTTLSEYKQRDQYIKDDHRYKDRIGNQPSRKTVHVWAEKEMANLVRLKNAGIPCPDVVHLKKHLLVMSLIGLDNRTPAPRLKHSPKKMVDLIMAYDQVVQIMKDMYSKANLIHADLSEYNILWFDKQCYVIDVSQSVEPSQENAFHLLMRDCVNVSNFFIRKNVPETRSPDELFEEITGCNFKDTEALLTIRETLKVKPHQLNIAGEERVSNFEMTWEKAQAGDLPLVEKAISDEDSPAMVEPPVA